MNFDSLYQNLSKSDLRKRYVLFYLLQYKKTVKILSYIGIIAVRLKIPFVKFFIKKYLFDVFVGGESLEECSNSIQNLQNNKIDVILDYGTEGSLKESKFQKNHQQIIKTILFARTCEIPFITIKLTSIADSRLLEKQSLKATLDEQEEAQYQKIITRLNTIAKVATDNKLKVLIDGEESWLQNAIDELCFRMMRIYNQQEACIYNTIQLYRNDKLAFLKNEVQRCRKEGIFYGAKLVRGAYVEKENQRAKTLHYTSPIHTSKEATDKDFNEALLFCLQHIHLLNIVIGSHNEWSVRYATEIMQAEKIKSGDNRIHFSQLFGMADPITFSLAQNGYKVSKYLPYGPLKDLLPYLLRRIDENSSVRGQARQELELIKTILEKR